MEKKRIGELLLEAGFITDDQLQQALRIQVGGNRRLGRIFLQMKAITADQLQAVLSSQLKLPIVDIEKEFDVGIRKIIPRYLCNRYSVLPLGMVNDQILKVAMTDPSDTEAIMGIEHLTGKAVEPCLARYEDIIAAIKKHIPFSIQDLFSPDLSAMIAKAAAGIALVLILGLGILTYQFYTQAKYGSITKTAESTLYKNLDLMVGFAANGNVTLLGRGAHAAGYYSITFSSRDELNRFLDGKKNDFSESQWYWVQWVLKDFH
jgi:hypothetical protein